MGGSHTNIGYDVVTYRIFFSKIYIKYSENKRSIEIDSKGCLVFTDKYIEEVQKGFNIETSKRDPLSS